MLDDARHVRIRCTPVDGSADDYDELVMHLATCKTVLIGEASHGAHEFYRERARLTQRLIAEHGFDAIAVEGDWPDTWRINEFVTGRDSNEDAVEALGGFERFPSWMWRNADVLDFVGWLHDYNQSQPRNRRVGFYGLDLYSLHSSMKCVIDFLDQTDPAAAERARVRYECLDGHLPDPQEYARQVALGLRPSCERDVLAQLLELRQSAAATASAHSGLSQDALFFARQNAVVVRNAERYYRTMFAGNVDSWNLRDRHMLETLVALQTHLQRQRLRAPRMIVWAHNSHVGDARATEMGRRGQWTLGQLVRQEQAEQCALVGMTTYHGTVSAARDWGAPVERRLVLPALPGSCEELFHRVAEDRFVLLPEVMHSLEVLQKPLLERAIGVIYRPETERDSHYFHAILARQFDALIHIDETRAVEPLERFAPMPIDELAETFPHET